MSLNLHRQPILVGQHSDKRDLNVAVSGSLATTTRAARPARRPSASAAAPPASGRAASARTARAHPEAVKKLLGKIEKAEERQDFMKPNAAMRKRKKDARGSTHGHRRRIQPQNGNGRRGSARFLRTVGFPSYP